VLSRRFSVHGTATVHLTGYYMPMEMEEETWKGDAPDDSDDEDYTPEVGCITASLLLPLSSTAALFTALH
jgi:hypothetical protein